MANNAQFCAVSRLRTLLRARRSGCGVEYPFFVATLVDVPVGSEVLCCFLRCGGT